MRYYISDCHFFHYSLNNRMDIRGFPSTEEMNEFMIKQWNKRIKKNDEVVILGDLSFGKPEETEEILKKLNGKKYLVTGNHDKFLKSPSFNKDLFVKISEYMELNDNGRKIILCHYPVVCYNGQNRLNAVGDPKVYMLYGHVHNTFDQELVDRFVKITRESKRVIQGQEQSIPCNMINCFSMRSNYIPLTLDEWIEVERKRWIEVEQKWQKSSD